LKAQWAQTGPGIPNTSKNHEFELHFGLSLDAQIDEKATKFQTPLGGGPQSADNMAAATLQTKSTVLTKALATGMFSQDIAKHNNHSSHLFLPRMCQKIRSACSHDSPLMQSPTPPVNANVECDVFIFAMFVPSRTKP